MFLLSNSGFKVSVASLLSRICKEYDNKAAERRTSPVGGSLVQMMHPITKIHFLFQSFIYIIITYFEPSSSRIQT